MGEAYRARDTRLDRMVAIKTAKAKFSERFAPTEGAPLKGPLPLEKAVEW